MAEATEPFAVGLWAPTGGLQERVATLATEFFGKCPTKLAMNEMKAGHEEVKKYALTHQSRDTSIVA